MDLQVVGLHKALAAHVAGVGPLARMQSHVPRQLVLRNKLLEADLALAGTLSGVLTHVQT